MNISSELEKLAELRDRGDLSKEEFEKAKSMVLSGQASGDFSSDNKASDLEKKTKTYRLISILSTITVALSAGSAIIAPSPINVLILVLFVVASTLNWAEYNKLRKKSTN
jgi:hypothetical protein